MQYKARKWMCPSLKITPILYYQIIFFFSFYIALLKVNLPSQKYRFWLWIWSYDRLSKLKGSLSSCFFTSEECSSKLQLIDFSFSLHSIFHAIFLHISVSNFRVVEGSDPSRSVSRRKLTNLMGSLSAWKCLCERHIENFLPTGSGMPMLSLLHNLNNTSELLLRAPSLLIVFPPCFRRLIWKFQTCK